MFQTPDLTTQTISLVKCNQSRHIVRWFEVRKRLQTTLETNFALDANLAIPESRKTVKFKSRPHWA